METTIPLGRAGKYGALAVNRDKFSAAVDEHIYVYGLRQILNDAIADKTDDDGVALPVDQLVAKAQKRLDNLYAGELRSRRDAAEPVDPVENEMFKMAKAALTKAVKETQEYVDTKGEKDRALAAIHARSVARGDETVLDSWPAAVAFFYANAEREAKFRRAATRIVKERALDENFDI